MRCLRSLADYEGVPLKVVNERGEAMWVVTVEYHTKQCDLLLESRYDPQRGGWWIQHGENREHTIFFDDGYWMQNETAIALQNTRFKVLEEWLRTVHERV